MADIGAIVGEMAGTLGKIVIFLVVIFGGFFGTKILKKHLGKKKKFLITCFISNPDGSHYVDYMGKFKDKDQMDKMMFRIRKQETCPVINPKHIVNRSVHLFRYGPGEFAIIPPTIYRNLDPKDFGIKLINANMLAFKGMEQRAAITRWQATKDRLTQFAPYIAIVISVGCALGAIYLVGQSAGALYADAIDARTKDCSELLPVETITESIVETLQKTNNIPANVVETTTNTKTPI